MPETYPNEGESLQIDTGNSLPIIIATKNQVVTEPSGANIYPEVSTQELAAMPTLGYDEGADQAALDYASRIFPEATLRILGKGSSAIILEDNQGYVFKVIRDAGHYSYCEDEMATITRLHQLGLAPAPILLVDAARRFRTETAGSSPKRDFSETEIDRVEVEGEFPIIIMSKVEHRSVRTLSQRQKVAIFDQVFPVLANDGIMPGDTEMAINITTGNPVFIDDGGFQKLRPGQRLYEQGLDGILRDRYPQLSNAELRQFAVAYALVGRFGVSLAPDDALAIWRRQGLHGMRQSLAA
jgi:hypothetical protein